MSMIGNYVRVKPEQLENLIDQPGIVLEFLCSESDGEHALNIHKSWGEIHYLLTGSAWGGKPPLSYVVLGGKELGNENESEYPYGQPRYILPEQVKEANDALKQLDMERVRMRYNSVNLEQHEDDIDTFDETDIPEEFIYYINEITAFFTNAAENGEGVVFWIS